MARKPKTDQPLTTAQRLGSIIKSARDKMRKDKGLNGDLDRLPMLTWIMFLKFLDDMERIREQEAELAGERFRPAIEPPYRWRDWATQEDGITGDELIAFVNNDEAVRPDGIRGVGLFAYLRSLQGDDGGDRRDTIRTVFAGTVNLVPSAWPGGLKTRRRVALSHPRLRCVGRQVHQAALALLAAEKAARTQAPQDAGEAVGVLLVCHWVPPGRRRTLTSASAMYTSSPPDLSQVHTPVSVWFQEAEKGNRARSQAW